MSMLPFSSALPVMVLPSGKVTVTSAPGSVRPVMLRLPSSLPVTVTSFGAAGATLSL
ncbi:hypothetical protein KTH09_17335 [Acinetobacter ursingii]|nr:hypothetical protein [Acinetobacter ursingii]MCU4353020.1 hypothetical protein [Acinetobacter ursingii]